MLSDDEKQGIAALLYQAELNAQHVRTWILSVQESLKICTNPEAGETDLFLCLTRADTAIKHAMIQQMHSDQVRAKLAEVLDLPNDKELLGED